MISIVAPVYNVEKYLEQFIESVLHQTYTDFELVLVEDCATDGSLQICKRYAAQDARIRVLAQSVNSGVAKARNRGMDETKGEYITLADSDDYLPDNALEILYTKMLESDADIVYGGFYKVIEPKMTIVRKNFHCKAKSYNREQAIAAHLNYRVLYGFPWGKLFKKGILQGVRDPEDMSSGDDGVFSFRALYNAQTVDFISEPVYYYRLRADSLTNRSGVFNDKTLQCMQQYNYVCECLKDKTPYKKAMEVFEFGLFSGAVTDYQNSPEDVQHRYQEQYRYLYSECRRLWKNVVWYSINPRMKLEALKWKLRN